MHDGNRLNGFSQVTGRFLLCAYAVVLVHTGFPAFSQSIAVRKESMGRLFFAPSQRSVLESVRQGVVDRNIARQELLNVVETTAIEVPDIVFKTLIKKNKDGILVREEDISYEGFVRKQGGVPTLLLNNAFVKGKDLETVESSLGVKFITEDTDGQSSFVVEDKLLKQRFVIVRGETVKVNGRLARSSVPPGTSTRFIVVKRDN